MPLTTEARTDLLEALQPVVAEIAEDLRTRLVTPQSAEEARFAVDGAARSKRESGDLEGAAIHLAREGARLLEALSRI